MPTLRFEKSNQSAHGSAPSSTVGEGGRLKRFPLDDGVPGETALQRVRIRHRVPEQEVLGYWISRTEHRYSKLRQRSRPRQGCGRTRPPAGLQLKDFVGSVERLAWARDHGCLMDTTVVLPSSHGQLDV